MGSSEIFCILQKASMKALSLYWEKMMCFVHAAFQSCQEQKREASLSLYLDIKALVHSDSSGLSILFLFQICHQHGVYIKDHFSVVLTTKEKKFEKNMKSISQNIPL